MWSNARGCPRVNGGGPLAVLATSVCSGRGGRRLVSQGGAPPHTPPRRSTRGLLSQGGAPPHTPPRRSTRGLLSQGGAPPHTPPRRSTRGFLGLGWQAGGCAGWAAGFPRRLLALIRARGEGAPSGLWWRAWGVCRVGCGGTRRRSASGLWARGEGAPSGLCAACRSGGGVGAQPPHKESPRAGGWATSGAARSSGMGVWGAQPPAGDARCALEGLSSGGRRTPSPPPSPARGEGAGGASGAVPPASDPHGGVGAGGQMLAPQCWVSSITSLSQGISSWGMSSSSNSAPSGL